MSVNQPQDSQYVVLTEEQLRSSLQQAVTNGMNMAQANKLQPVEPTAGNEVVTKLVKVPGQVLNLVFKTLGEAIDIVTLQKK